MAPGSGSIKAARRIDVGRAMGEIAEQGGDRKSTSAEGRLILPDLIGKRAYQRAHDWARQASRVKLYVLHNVTLFGGAAGAPSARPSSHPSALPALSHGRPSLAGLGPLTKVADGAGYLNYAKDMPREADKVLRSLRAA